MVLTVDLNFEDFQEKPGSLEMVHVQKEQKVNPDFILNVSAGNRKCRGV